MAWGGGPKVAEIPLRGIRMATQACQRLFASIHNQSKKKEKKKKTWLLSWGASIDDQRKVSSGYCS